MRRRRANLLAEYRLVVVQVLKMVVLFQHGRFVDVAVGRDAMIVRVFRQLANVSQVVPTNIDIEKGEVTIHILFVEDIFQVLSSRDQRFGKVPA